MTKHLCPRALARLALAALLAAGASAQEMAVVDGDVESTSGGFRFPDGTLQNTAWAGGSPYAEILVVAPAGGDFTSIQAALDSITDASISKRYLVHVAPGDYLETVTMKTWVDIEGAGERQTTIRSVTGLASRDSGTVVCANHSELRDLTVEMAGPGDQFAIAIYCLFTSPRLTRVTARATDANYVEGIHMLGAFATLTDVQATADGNFESTGIYLLNSSPKMTRVTAEAKPATIDVFALEVDSSSSPEIVGSYLVAEGTGTDSPLLDHSGAVIATDTPVTITDTVVVARNGGTCAAIDSSSTSTVTIVRAVLDSGEGCAAGYGIVSDTASGAVLAIHHSKVTSTDATIDHAGSGTVNVAMSQLAGSTIIGTGTTNCVGVYDEDYLISPTTCP